MLLERESQILTVVNEAMKLSRESWLTFLNSQIGSDGIALAEAQRILGYETRSRSLSQTQTLKGFQPGKLVGGRFRIVRLLGRGGMGDVYEAEDVAQIRERRVALKTIRSDISGNASVADQFKKEIGLGQTITHPNVCRIYDLGIHLESDSRSDGAPSSILFLTMELLSGCTLAEHLRKSGPMEPAGAMELIRQIADALNAAHDLNIVHRDLKPGNIILTAAAKGGYRAVVTDFGLAIEIPRAHGDCVVTSSCGTPDYMSPEQVQGSQVGCSSDIYSLGLVAYEMVTGRYPFDGQTSRFRMVQRLYDDPIPPSLRRSGLAPDWSPQILHCLQREPKDRFASANEFAGELARAFPPAGAMEKRPAIADSAPSESRRLKPAAARKVALWMFSILLLTSAILGTRTRIANLLHPLPAERRIAVLRFENIGGSETDRAFSDGLMQTVVSQLTQLEPLQGSLSIVPATEIRKNNITTAKEANVMFGATLVISGSVERSERGVHLIINLVDARMLKQLRSKDFVITPDDVAGLQGIAERRLADLLELELEPQEVKRLSQDSTAVPHAYDFYLQGSGYLSKRDGQDQAITEFKHALELDPRYALAFAGLGEAYWAKYVATKDRSWVKEAWKQSQQALQINPNLSRAYTTLAILQAGTGKFADAIIDARRAIEIDPTDDRARAALAGALGASGQDAQAEATLKQAIALRPNNPLSYGKLATFYYSRARYDDAITEYRRVIDLVPDNPAGYTNLGIMYLKQGRLGEAEKMFERSLQIQPSFQASSNLATLYFGDGRYGEAVSIMEGVVKTNPKNFLMWGNLADDYRWAPGKEQRAGETYRQAILLAEDELKVNPKDAATLSSEGLYRAKSGDIARALANSEKAIKEAPRDPDILFDAVVINEIAHRRDAALIYLSRAVALGYSKSDIQRDPELRALRQDPRYQGAVH